MYKVICKPVIVPMGDRCFGKDADLGLTVSCHHFNNTNGMVFCEQGFPTPQVGYDYYYYKPKECRDAYLWTDHKEKKDA